MRHGSGRAILLFQEVAMSRPPALPVSPCIDICHNSRRGHCSGCSMTQAQKRHFAGLKNREQRAEFVQMIRDQQSIMGGYDPWNAVYAEKVRNTPDGESISPSGEKTGSKPEPEKG